MEGDGLTLGLVNASGDATLTNGEAGKYLSFGTNGTERMRIDPNGYVGIGTTAPQWNMQLNSPSGEAVLQLTAATSTGSFDLDGLLLGINSGGANLTNMENTGLFLGNANGNSGISIADDGNVGIGIFAPAYKFHVATTTNSYGSYFSNTSGNSMSTHVVHAQSNHTGNIDVVAINGQNTISGYYGYGVIGEGGYVGVRGVAQVSGAQQRYGVYGTAGGSSGACYGIYGIASGTGTYYAGYFAGDVYSSGAYLPSDAALKSNVKTYDNALASITAIPVKSYSYKNDGIYGKMHLPQGNQVGIMAQDMEAVYPQLVKQSYFEDAESYMNGSIKKEEIESVNFKAVNYTGLVPIMIKGMQEQQQIIEDLKAEMEALKKEVQSLKQ